MPVDTYSEAWRCSCEARGLLRQYAPQWEALELRIVEIEKKRGAQLDLRSEIKRQWAARKEWWHDSQQQSSTQAS